jgi:O-antigen/teichoic acid export membrane protein
MKAPLSETKTSRASFSGGGLAATIGKGAIFGVVSSGAQIGTRLITVPVVIHHLGLSGYGIWSIIIVTAAYMRFGSAGIKSAFQKYVAEATGNGDFETANKLVSTGSITMLVLSLMGLIPTALLSRKIAAASGVPPEFLAAAAASIAMLACIYLVANFGAAFEAIVMGGHRIDLTRKYSTVLTLCEASVIVVLLHRGLGLLAMTSVMGASELIYIYCCYRASHQVVPQMQISTAHFTKSVLPELVRFAGSYQLVNVLELLYGAVLSVIVLKMFGAESAGVFALASRVVSSFLIGQDALVLPILSGGTMVFASKSTERIRLFLAKSFKATLAASLPPLAYVAAFGTTMIFAWTGEANPELHGALWLTALAALLRAISLLQLILYRASGKALLDNIRQVLRIAAVIVVALFARRIGFNGVLAGIACAELVGVVFMFVAMATVFHAFSAKTFARDAFRISLATVMIVAVGIIVGTVPVPWNVAGRLVATIKLGEITLGCLFAALPALMLTKSISSTEKNAMLAVVSRRRPAMAVNE